MAIITYNADYKQPQDALINKFPDQYVNIKTKETDGWKKQNMDYYYSIAINRYAHAKKTLARNYEITKGILKREDFYEQPEVKDFTSLVLKTDELPAYVQHYSILTSPINVLIGEMTKRPDNTYVKAFDDDSKSEELQYKTEILQKYIFDRAKQQIYISLAQEGHDVDPAEIDAMTEEQVEEHLTAYTSLAERWGSRKLDYLKVRFGLREKSEEGFRDLLITAREFFHIYEDKSPEGFNVEVLNPVNTWFVTTPNEKYISDPFDRYRGAFAAGTIEIMEMSQILNKFDLTHEEVEHLKKYSQQNYLLSGHESNLVNPTEGYEGIKYSTYNPLLLQERMMLEAEFNGTNNTDELNTFLLPGSEISTFGNKFIVVRAYWCSKLKIGKLTYIDSDGFEQVKIVDENYKSKEHPGEISLEWGWVNQWYQGVKIGPDIYYVKPFELFDYCPIIGSIFEGKNTEPKSLVDLLKPYQTLCNIYMNKLYQSINKDAGPVLLTSLRSLPIPKDGDPQDAISIWMQNARENGVIFVDDNPENMAAASNFNQHKVQDMSRVNEMKGYMEMYYNIKNEALELVGINRQRLGSVKATETATGTNASLNQSYSQTEPWFMHHEYTLNKLYQAILDASLYIESKKPESVVSYISNDGEQAFVKVNGSDLKLKDLGVLVTSRAEDAEAYHEMRMLSQAMLQNGASAYDVAVLWTTKSMRQMKDTFKRLKKEQMDILKQQQELEQQKLQQTQQQFEQQQQLLLIQHEKDVQNENMNKALDRESKERIAIISATGYGQVQAEDLDGDGVQDVLEQQRISADEVKTAQDYQMKIQELSYKQQELLNKNNLENKKLELEKEKIKVARENMKNDLEIEKQRSKNRNKSQSK